jgi:hypothetical protein
MKKVILALLTLSNVIRNSIGHPCIDNFAKKDVQTKDDLLEVVNNESPFIMSDRFDTELSKVYSSNLCEEAEIYELCQNHNYLEEKREALISEIRNDFGGINPESNYHIENNEDMQNINLQIMENKAETLKVLLCGENIDIESRTRALENMGFFTKESRASTFGGSGFEIPNNGKERNEVLKNIYSKPFKKDQPHLLQIGNGIIEGTDKRKELNGTAQVKEKCVRYDIIDLKNICSINFENTPKRVITTQKEQGFEYAGKIKRESTEDYKIDL